MRIEQEMFDFFDAKLDEHGYAGDLTRRHAFIDDDVRLNTAGLESGWTEGLGTGMGIVKRRAAA